MTVLVDQLGLWPGQRIGGYEVVGEIGGGGIGMVYRAIHVLLGRAAAIKVLRPEYSHVAAVVERFFTEAQLTTSIRHPGIVEIFDYGHTDDGRAYIVMELLAGDSLAHRLARTGRLPTVMAAVLARRIAAALSAAHDRGVVHRDLKPDNIHLVRDPDGGTIDQIKLLDFGIAKRVERSSTQRTTTGVLIGTPVYMAPEQCRGAGDTDHRVDLYALGCVLFEMLVGRPPFVARSAGELLAAHIHAPPPDLRDHVASASPGLVKLVARLLAKDPAARPATAEQVVRELDELLVTLAAPSRPRRALTVVASATGFLAIVASLFLSRGRRATAPGHPPGPDPVVARPAPLASLPPMPAADLDAAVTGVWVPPAPPAASAQPPASLPQDPVATSAPTVPIRIRPPRAHAPAARDQDGVTFELGDGSADDAIDTVVRDP